jgi:type I restriction enzyme S subunit
MNAIPPGWTIARLGDVAELVRGVTYKKEQASSLPVPGFVPILRATNVKAELVLNDDLVFVPDSVVSSPQLLRVGDIVVASSSGSVSVVGKSAMLRRAWRGSFGAFCTVLRSKPGIDAAYIGNYVASPITRRTWSSLAAGTNINNLKRQHFEELVIPLPPLAEQKRIVEAIDEQLSRLEAGEASLSRASIALTSLADYAMGAALSGRWTDGVPFAMAARSAIDAKKGGSATSHRKPRRSPITASPQNDELPAGWTWAHVDDIAAVRPNAVKAGPFGSALKKADYVATGYKIYGQEQVIRGDPYYGDYYISPQKYETLKTCAVAPRDLLISLVGTIGRTLVLPHDAASGIINPRLVKISLDERVMLPEFLALVLRAPSVRAHLKHASHGGTMDVLNLGMLRGLPIPCPPIEHQGLIVRRIHALRDVVAHLSAQLDIASARVAALRSSILMAAFSGTLVSQDPTDEPAFALLERMTAVRECDLPGPRRRRAVSA